MNAIEIRQSGSVADSTSHRTDRQTYVVPTEGTFFYFLKDTYNDSQFFY
jgi:hypothetical protein